MAINNQDPNANPAAPVKVKATARRIMALELRKQGASYRKIADQLRKMPGISQRYGEGGAYEDVMRGLRDLMETQNELAKENLRLDLDRLDEIFKKVFENAKKGDLMSANTVLQIIAARGKLLNYAALTQAPNQNLNIDVTKLSTAQLERIANGEDPLTVLATPSAG